MNKKFLSAILFGALMVTSTGTFVSCKDYDEDIDGLQTQVDSNKSAIAAVKGLETQVTALQAALGTAQSTADAAKKAAADAATAAAAAKTAGDAAMAEAQAAKASAEAATAAAAQAKADAIAAAIKEANDLKAWVEAQGYLTKDDLAIINGQAAAVLELSAKVEAIETGLSTLKTDIKGMYDGIQEQINLLTSTSVSNIVTLQEELALQQATLDNYEALMKELQAGDEELWADLTTTKNELGAAITALNNLLEDQTGELWNEIALIKQELGASITALINTHADDKAALEGALEEAYNSLGSAIGNLSNISSENAEAIAALEGALEEAYNSLGTTIGNVSNLVADNAAGIAALEGALEEAYNTLGTTLGNVSNLVADNAAQIDELWVALQEGKNELGTAIGNLNNLITDVDANLSVLATLVNNQLTSLAFIPEVINHHGLGVVEFYSLELEDADGETVYVSNVPTATYRVNPTNAAQADYTWSFINRAVTTRAAGDATDLLTVTKSEAAAGSRTFWLQVNKDVVDTYANDGKEAIFALKAANGEREIVSDYATVTIETLKDFALAQLDEDGQKVKYYSAAVPAIATTADVELVYTSTLDLNPIVEAWSTTVPDALVDLNVEGIKYEFEMVEEYLGADGITDQQKFITLDKGVVAVDKTWLNKGTAAIGRTPVIKAVATVNGLEIATGFIKVVIVKEPTVAPTVKEDLVINVALGDIDYTEIATGNDTYKLDWTRVNAEIYDVLGLTKSTFATKYVGSPFTLVPQGVTAGTYLYNNTQTTESAFAYIQFSDQVNLGDFHVNVTFKANDNYAYPNVVVKFTYNIVHTPSIPALNPDYLIGTNIIQVKGRMEGGAWKLISDMNEHFTNYLAGYTLPGNHTNFYFRLKVEDPAQTGVIITGTDYSDQVIELTTPFEADETSRDYNVQAVVELANGKECVYDYVVRFVRPFNATVDAMTLKTFIANPDSKDLAELVVIKDLDGEVLYEEGLFTQYAKDTYNIDATSGITFDYDIDFDATFGNKLSISGSEVTWYNGGADLQQDKTAASVVTITIPNIATIESEGVITVLSTENSKK